MKNNYFKFKEFIINQEKCGMKVTTDACILGAWFAEKINNPEKILDIGCGTGLISLMLAQKNSGTISAIEIEKDCAEQAIQNISLSPWHERIELINDDVRHHHFKMKFDFIISNPPFHDSHLPSPDFKINNARHSQTLTLKDLCMVISNHISKEGEAGILLPYYRTEEAITLFNNFGFYISQLVRIRQTENHDFFRSILYFSKNKKSAILEEEIIIKYKEQYSTQFIHLLKDYYLNI